MTRPILVLALLLTAPLASAALPTVGVILAAGPGHHTYVTTATCEADANFVVELDPTDPRAITVLGDTTCLAPLPYFSGITGCTGGLGETIECRRDTATAHVFARLATDGGFYLEWFEADFREIVNATLQRTDV